MSRIGNIRWIIVGTVTVINVLSVTILVGKRNDDEQEISIIVDSQQIQNRTLKYTQAPHSSTQQSFNESFKERLRGVKVQEISTIVDSRKILNNPLKYTQTHYSSTKESFNLISTLQNILKYTQKPDQSSKVIGKLNSTHQHILKYSKAPDQSPKESGKLNSILQYKLNKNQHRCQNFRRPKESDIKILDNSWQVHEQGKSSVYIYSAYYDDRPAVGLHALVRIIALASLTSPEQQPVFCHIWYDSFEEPFVVNSTINETGLNRFQFGDRGYREYTFTCRLPVSHPVPTHVSITRDLPCSQQLTTFEPVHYVPRQEPPIEFGVCVTNGYGHYPINEIVEWIEIQRFYGVEEFNFYDTNYSNMSKIFNYYKGKGLLNVYSMPHPLGLTELYMDKIRNLRTTSLNDCMYRNMYRYRYIIALDLDELIVPRRPTNYTVMLDQVDVRLNLSKRFYAYSFSNVYFYQEFDQFENERLRSLRFRYRVNHDQGLYGSKSMISPLCCFNLFNHYCLILLPGFDKQTEHVPSVIASNHHYRKCSSTEKGCENRFKEKVLDNVMLRVKSKITKRIEPVLHELDKIQSDYLTNR